MLFSYGIKKGLERAGFGKSGYENAVAVVSHETPNAEGLGFPVNKRSESHALDGAVYGNF